MKGSLPPSSRTVFFICDVALCATFAPTGMLPVNVTALISESIRIQKHGNLLPEFGTPWGKPTLLQDLS